MPAQTGIVALLFLCVGSFALLLQAPPRPIEEMDEHDEQWFAQNSRYSANGSYIMLVDGVMIGVIAGLLVARISKDVLPSPVMGFEFLCVALAFFLFDRKAPRLLDLGRSQLVLLPVLVCGLVLSGFLDAPWNTFAALPLFAFVYLFDYTNSSVLSLRGNLLSVSPCYCYAKGRFFIIFGRRPDGSWEASSAPTSRAGAARRVRLPDRAAVRLHNHRDHQARQVSHRERVLARRSGIDRRNAPPPPEPVIERPYKRKCTQATMAYDLTPREGEILFYLAKGRNAKYIADQLYVAERTVKTHTYHIYQKMGIHSQQELIDIVENEEGAGRAASS